MYLRNTLSHLFGRKEFAGKSVTEFPAAGNCPDEADILAYLEDKLSRRCRALTENHFAGCDNCRELLALLAQPSENEAGLFATLPEDEIKAQTASVLSLIGQDELNSKVAGNQGARAATNRAGFSLSYSRLATIALVVCAVLAGLIYVMTRRPSPEYIAGQALAQAMQDGRRTPVRISGGLAYSEYLPPTRGEGDDDNPQLQGALYKLEDVDRETASPKARHELARVHLAFNRQKNTKQAFSILTKLEADGIQSAELLNDIGVAQFNLGKYAEAIDSFDRALAKLPDYGEALFNKARAKEHVGRVDEAIQDWQRFIRITPDGPWKAEARHNLAELQRLLSNQPVESR